MAICYAVLSKISEGILTKFVWEYFLGWGNSVTPNLRYSTSHPKLGGRGYAVSMKLFDV